MKYLLWGIVFGAAFSGGLMGGLLGLIVYTLYMILEQLCLTNMLLAQGLFDDEEECDCEQCRQEIDGE